MVFTVNLYCGVFPPSQISSNSASTSPEPWKLRYIIACDLAEACIYRQLLRPSMGCLLETLFFPILMASTVLKEILLLASVILPQLALLGWGVLGAWGPSNSIAPYIIDLQVEILHCAFLRFWKENRAATVAEALAI